MSAPSISDANLQQDRLRLLGISVSAAGLVSVDGQVLAGVGTAVAASPGGASFSPADTAAMDAAVVSQPLAVGPRWLAEQVSVQGRCILLRLRPRRSAWRRWWSARFGEPAAQEQARAARWGLPPQQRTAWGVVECGADIALNGAAVITLRVAELPAGLPPASRAFFRQRTPAECRALVAAALSGAAADGPWSFDTQGLRFADGESIVVRPAGGEPANWAPVGFEWQEAGAGAWRVRGARAGWRFTLAYTESAGKPVLAWAMARLAVAHEGPWDPLLEAELHRVHQRWLRAARRETDGGGQFSEKNAGMASCTARAVNDIVARTGAELLLEWR
jgi:hypothetical protein